VERFRLYKSEQKDEKISSKLFLLHVDFKEKEELLLKLKPFN